MLLIKKSFLLSKKFYLFYFKNLSFFLLIGKNGLSILKLPVIYYQKKLSFIFINHYYFKSFFKSFFTFYNRLFLYYFFRLKLKGLGFKIKIICDQFLYRFYFISVNFIYFHLPKTILLKLKGKKLFFISSDLAILQIFIGKLLLLRASTAYRKKGLFFPKEIITMKPGKKKF